MYYISKKVGTRYRVFDFYKLRPMYLDVDKRLKEMKHLNQYSSKSNSEKDEQQRVLSGDGMKTLLLFQDRGTVEERSYLDKKAASEGAAFMKIANDPRITKIGRSIRLSGVYPKCRYASHFIDGRTDALPKFARKLWNPHS